MITGYWELHQKYGKMQWSKLFDPVIELCRKGHVVSRYLSGILNKRKNVILNSPSLSEIYINPQTNDVYQEGDFVKRNKLADTLEIIKREGADTLYNNGTIAKLLVEDIQKLGGIITIDDFLKYQVRWEKPISTNLKNNKTMYSLPLPGSGSMLAFIMNVLNDYLPHGDQTLSMHRIIEAFKFAYAKRTELGDSQFVPRALEVEKNLTSENFAMEIRKLIEDDKTYNDYKHYGAYSASKDDHGTAHINILASNGDAISVTATINTLYVIGVENLLFTIIRNRLLILIFVFLMLTIDLAVKMFLNKLESY